MSFKRFLPVLVLFAASSVLAEDVDYLRFSDFPFSKDFKEKLEEKDVTLHWAGAERPTFSEYTLPESHTGTSKRFSGTSRRDCVKALEEALEEFIDDADSKGYDAVVDLALQINGRSSDDARGFNCKLGEPMITITLTGRLALSDVSADVLAAVERKQLRKGIRQPSPGSIFLPLVPVLSSPEAKSILGDGIKADWRFPPAPYSYRKGPNDYDAETDITSAGKEEACNRAVLTALGTMVDEAKRAHYDRLIKVRSYLGKKFVFDPSQFECEISKKSVSVTLQASMAKD